MNNKKHIEDMTRKEFEQVPYRENWNKPVFCSTLVILPTKIKHDSGWRCMDFVAIDKEGYPICRCSGCSDVLNLNGIGGDRMLELHKRFDPEVAVGEWSIDCLMKSGLLRIINRTRIKVCSALSNCEIYSIKEEN